jgi:hypothetical protein
MQAVTAAATNTSEAIITISSRATIKCVPGVITCVAMYAPANA